MKLGVPKNNGIPVPKEVTPVPPFAAANVPDKVIVPEFVTGLPLTVNPVVPPLTPTDVTVPLPLGVPHT